jgi:opacity protein-like surface antigen
MQNQHASAPLKLIVMAAGFFGAATAGIAPLSLFATAAQAQDEGGHGEGGSGGGHEGGGEDGGDEGGGHEEGGGKGKGKGGKPVPPVVVPVVAVGQGDGAASGTLSGNVQPGNYIRIELGATNGSAGDASWLPPGYPSDPQVFFDLDLDAAAMGAVAVGRSYGNGWRAEAALNIFGTSDFSGPWSFTVPATPGPHADVEGSVRSVALLANGYYDFASVGRTTPFVTAGLGVARNTISDWTRINPDAGRTRRSFEGGSDTGLAWSIGAGIATDVGPVLGSAPAKLELAWRYFDLGSVSGGTTPLPGSGAGGIPVEGLNFDVTDHVISIGLRIPL